MGNTVNKPLDVDIDISNIIYDKNIKDCDDALCYSITKYGNTDINHLIGFPEERSFTVTSFEKYGGLYYYYTNYLCFDCDIIEKLKVNTEGKEKIKMFIEINQNIYDIGDKLRILTLALYGKNIKLIFCTAVPITKPFYVSYDAYVASKKYRYYLLHHRIIYENIEYDNGRITHISPYTNTKIVRLCKKFFTDDIPNNIEGFAKRPLDTVQNLDSFPRISKADSEKNNVI